MINRRDFLKSGLAASALSLAGSNLLESMAPAPVKLTVLHTNDVHSYIDPFPANHPKFAGKGGVSRRAAWIEKIRSEEANVLLLDAGDIFQGTPYFNYYGGELEFKLMSLMKYDLATMGNHDFDNGLEGFYKQLPNATFGFVSANYDFSKTILDGLVPKYKVLHKAGLKIGVFGLGVGLQGLVDKRNYKETVYLDPVEMSQECVRVLREQERCDLVICLSHIGYDYKDDADRISDLKLAARTSGIDAIIGGHTHTFLEKPTVVKNKDGHEVIVNQTGCYGVNLGRLDFFFDKGKARGQGLSIAV